jgi:hypothetical protein
MIVQRLLEVLVRQVRWLGMLYHRAQARATNRAPLWFWTRVEEDPDVAAPWRVYLVGEGNGLWKAVFRCPCGCGELIELSLHRVGRPRWIATPHLDGRITLRPSVWRTTGCRSHFILERGRVIFVEEPAHRVPWERDSLIRRTGSTESLASPQPTTKCSTDTPPPVAGTTQHTTPRAPPAPHASPVPPAARSSAPESDPPSSPSRTGGRSAPPSFL